MKKNTTHPTGSLASEKKQATHRNGNCFPLKHLLVIPIFLMALLWADLGWGQTTRYWKGTGTWTSANQWAITEPTYTTTWVSNDIAVFNVASSTVTFVSTGVRGITANQNVTLTAAGTMTTNGTQMPVFVASGMLLNLQAQAISTAAGTGFIKNGAGTLQLAGSAYIGGFVLNAGMLAAQGINAMGDGGTLTINGGTIAGTGNRTFTGKYDLGITIGGDFTLGSATAPALSTATLLFDNAISLGASTTRTITLGGTGVNTINSIISGAGSNLIVGAGSTGVLLLTAANTYSGTTTVSGGELRHNPAANLTMTGGFTFNGGTLATTGITATRTITYASINLSENSTLALANASAHTLTFTSLGTFTSGKMLTIAGWTGVSYYTGTTAGTNGKVFIGSSAFLTADQLAQIRFYNGTNYFAATQLSTGQIVPTLSLVVTNPGTQTAGVGFSVTVTAKNLDGVATNMVNTTGITLTTNGNAGAIGGTTTGSITSGTNAVTITGVTLASAGTLVTITATRSSGDYPFVGTSGTFTVNSAAPPEIDIQGNSVSIIDGDASPSAGDWTDFGNADITSGTVDRTFTIYNTGTSILTLSGTPKVAVSGTHAADFTVTSLPTSPVAVSGNTTFTVQFNPSATGTRSATLTIANDDANEGAYDFAIQGKGTIANSTASDIIRNTGFSEPTNIAYASYQSANIIADANDIEVAKFDIRDGAGSADADALGTTLTDITFTVSNWANIKRLAIYDGATEKAEVAVSSGTVTYTGLSGLTAADGSTPKTFSLRASFNSTVTDNQQLQFTVTSATADAAGSTFAAANAGGAVSSITGDANRIEVTADRLGYVVQPSNTAINSAMTAVTVEAKDVNGNRDLDFTANIQVSSTGTLTGSPVSVAASSGLATFSTLTHTAAGTGLTINAERAGTTDWDVTSNSFNITSGPCLSENFSGFTANGSTEISSTLDTYTQTTGWTGSKIYCNSGEAKLGSSSSAGYIISPTINLTTGAYISFDIKDYGDAGTMVQVFHAPDGTTFTQVGSDITPPVSYTTQTIYITGGTSSSKIKIATSAKRVYLDNVSIYCSSSVSTITVSPITLTGFTYASGSGPSAEQSYTISGANLTANISIVPPTNYEISTGTGGSFSATNPITLTQSGGTVCNTTIYVRLKAGLSAGTYNSETITASSTGSTSQTVTCSGTVTSFSCIFEGFEGGTSDPTGWTNNSAYYNTTEPHIGSYMAGMNALSDWVRTTTVVNPKVLTFWCKASSTTSNYTIKIQTSTDGSTWTDNTFFSATGSDAGDVTSTYSQKTVDFCLTGTYYIRWLMYSRTAGSFYFDDVEVICGSCASKPEPTNHPTVFTCGNTTNSTIPLTWTDADAGTQAPDGYLIKWSTTSFAAVTAPSDETAVADGASAQNVAYGTQAYTPTGLTPNTTYYFKILSYTNSGISINYKTDGTIQQTSCMTQVGPCLTQGFNGTITDLTVAGWLSSGCLSIISGACEGSRKLGFDLTGDYVVTPALVNPIELTFQYDKSSNTDPWELKVQYNTAQTGTFTTLATISNATTSCQTYTVDLGAYAAQTIYIKFLDTRTSGTAQRYIDDVKVYCSTTCSQPTTASTVFTTTSVTNASMVLGWTSGNGTNRIVVAREGSAVNFTPADGTSYTANSDFSQATDLGNGNKIIYKGSSNLVSLTGLNLGTTYYFAVYEFNCSNEMEDYFATPLTGNQTTSATPNPVTDLQVICQTNTTAIISWTAPVGTYEGVIISLRNSTLDCGSLSGDGSIYAANTAFGSGYSYGVAPLSYVVSNGVGATVTVSGLTAGQPYKVMAYTYNASTWSATQPTTTITALALSNPLNASLSPASASMLMTWNTPSCASDVMIVCKAGSFTAASPTGDGSAYTADLNFGGSGSAFDGGKVVYRGGVSPQTVTGLTNGVSYCFKFFTRSGTEWSSGYSDCETPIADVTQFLPGGIAVLGVNSNTYSTPAHCIAGTTAGDDEISIVTFQDITAGTTLDMTDNGWEKCHAGQWGNQEGYMRIKRTGTTIPAGTIITFRLNQGAVAHFTGLYPDNDWSIEIENGPMIFNSNGDQLYFMQGGTWNQGTVNANNATYTGGTFLFAFNTNDTWTAGICAPDNNTSGTGRSQNSGLLFGLECFNMVPNVATDYLKYVGDMATKTQRDWIAYIKDGDNWTNYADCQTYYDGTPDFINTVHTIPITTVPVNYLAGVWTGAGGNTDWFYCGNWDNLRVPDKTVNVELPSTSVANSCNIGAPPSPFTEASCLSITNNLTTPYVFSIDNISSKFDIWGNFTNNYTFIHTAGLVTFKGTAAQTLSANASYVPTFFNMTLNNNSSTGLTINSNINISINITLTDGVLTTGTKVIELLGSTSTITETGMAPSSYVTGNVKVTRNIGTSSSTQTFGGIGLDITQTGADNSTVVTRTTGTSILVGTTGEGILRYFDITPTTNSGLSATMVFHYFDHEIAGYLPEVDLQMWKAPSPYSIWSFQTATLTVGSNISTKTGIPEFSRWTLAPKNKPLPVELLQFEAVCNNNQVDLAWSTASEINNDYFTIEKSIDAKIWDAVATIKGLGNTNMVSYYSYTDKDINGKSTYYRLKQTDFNGKYEYFDPVVVTCDEVLWQMNLYPNPASGQTICSVYSNIQSLASLEISNTMGIVVFSEKFELQNGFNLLNLDISEYQTGVYYVIVRSSDGSILGYKQLIIN